MTKRATSKERPKTHPLCCLPMSYQPQPLLWGPKAPNCQTAHCLLFLPLPLLKSPKQCCPNTGTGELVSLVELGSSCPALQMPLRETQGPQRIAPYGTIQERGPVFNYQPFSTTDLLNWKHYSPSYSEKPQALIDLLESIFQIQCPTWVDCQQLLKSTNESLWKPGMAPNQCPRGSIRHGKLGKGCFPRGRAPLGPQHRRGKK